MKKTLLSLALLFITINNFGQVTNIPDGNFEQALIDLGLDDVLDNTVLTSNISNISNLNVRNKNISDLTGISDFISITTLNIGDNNISSIDLSNNTNLTGLLCYNNNLTSLSLINNTNLTLVNCSENQLTDIDLSNNLVLSGFYCALNNLTSLDLSLNNMIDRLWCYDNNLTELNIKNGANNLLSGTFSSGTNTYSKFIANQNPNLTCIYVNDATDANNFTGDYLNWVTDASSTFIETEAECNTLSISDETILENIELYPNPTSGFLYFNKSQTDIKNITIFNTLGQKIMYRQKMNKIDLSNFPNGIYYLNIENTAGYKKSFNIIKAHNNGYN